MKESTPLEYARMLEIPVSTCSVTVKRGKKKKRKLGGDALKEEVIGSVNARLSAAPTSVAEEVSAPEQTQAAELEIPCDEQGELAVLEERQDGDLAEASCGGEDFTDVAVSSVTVERRPKKKLFGFFHRGKKEKFNIVMAQFLVAAALVAVIFLTNVFMPGSAINRIIRAAFSPSETVETVSQKHYTEFAVESPYRAGDVAVEGGVMTFSGEGTLYAPCDGVIQRIVEEAGKKTLEIEHSKTFRTVLSGVDFAYCDVGDLVYGALPVAYVNGGTVTVAMYHDGVLLDNYVIDGGAIVWQS